jgi:general secretion pathway protein C
MSVLYSKIYVINSIMNIINSKGKYYSILNLILAISILISILFLIRSLISIYYQKSISVGKTGLSKIDFNDSKKRYQLQDYAQIFKNNPFGFNAGELRPLIGQQSSIKKIVDLKLVGTVVGPDSLSYAIFVTDKGQEFYKVGQVIPDYGKVYKVMFDKVLIKQDERLIKVQFEDLKVKEVAKSSNIGEQFAQKVGKGMYVVDQEKLKQAIDNPDRIMTDARLRPNNVNGRQEGFILSEVKTDGIYSNLGLQNGDVLLRINDYDISNPERALQAFTSLKGMDRVRVDLIRNGNRMTMTYQIR